MRRRRTVGRPSAWKSIIATALLLLPMTVPAVQQNTQPTRAESSQGQAGRNAGVRPKRTPERRQGSARAAATASDTGKGAPSASAAQGKEVSAEALQAYAPVLAAADFSLLGLSVTAGPATQTVPKNTPTSVLTSLDVPAGADAAAAAAALNPNFRVRGELTGPSLIRPVTVEARVGEPLRLPALTSAGDHVVQNLRVVDIGTPDQETVAPVTPDACGVVVIDRLLVSEVHVNELTYDQIVQSGINISDDSYSYFNFTLGVATQSASQQINIPVAFPGVGVPDPRPIVGLPSVPGVGVDVPVPVPDVLPVMLEVDGRRDDLDLPDGTPVRIPGVVVFPGRIGLLHQFFEATVIVANGAPGGTPLVVRQLRARIKLPDAGTPADAADDPLRVAETQAAGRVTEIELHGLGADGKYGTPDDTDRFAPGQSGQASFLVEGLKEGLHTINFDLEGTLEGLPGGAVTVRGEVPGAVLVRDASFGVTFTHPSVVRAGQEYELAMTLYNSGQRDIQGAAADLSRGGVSGAELLGQEIRRQFGPVKRGEQATVKWRLRAGVTGAVTASYAKVGEGVESGLTLVTGVGDRNVPLSPDSLILPDTVRNLPPDAVEAARGLLGQAWSIANAPPGALPEGVTPVDKRTVVERAVELGLAGLRAGFGEPAEVALLTLARDWLGELQQLPDTGFADAMRDTAAGYAWYDSVGATLRRRMGAGATPRELLTELSDAESPRSPFVAALVTQAPGEPAFGARLAGGGGAVGFGATPEAREGVLRAGGSLRLAGAEPAGDPVTTTGQLLLVSKPADELWSLEVSGWRDATVDISLLAPAGDGTYRQFVFGGVQVAQGSRHRVRFRPAGGGAPALEEFRDGSFQPTGVTAAVAATLAEPPPRVVGVVQVTPDVIAGGDRYGRLVGVLFSKPMLRANAEAVANYTVGGGALKGSNPPEQVGGPIAVRGARLDYGDRFVFLSLDSPVGPYVERDLGVGGVTDRRGNAATPSGAKTPISMRVSTEGVPPGAYLTGRVTGADGTPVAGARVLYWTHECDELSGGLPKDPAPIAQRVTDAQGRYSFDYVRDGDCGPLVVTVRNPATLSEKRLTTPVAYDGQHMTLDAVFLARGKVRGTVTSGGRPLGNAVVQVVPTLDAVGTKVVQADSSGNYLAEDIPVGNVTVLAVGTGQAVLASGIGAGTIEGPGATAVVNISLQNTSGAVRGHVVNPDAAQTPASGALVVAYASIPGFANPERGDSASPVGYTYSGRDGSFAIENLPVGTIKLEVTDYVTRVVTSQQVQLSDVAPEASGLLVVLPGYGEVKGRVVDEAGNFMPLAVVTGAGRSVQADALGAYTLPNMPAGTHELTAIDPQTLMTGTARAQVRFGQTTTGINIPILRAATITGRVTINENGASTPAAKVYVTTDGYHKFPTDEQGRYTVRNVQPNTELKLRFVDPVRNLVLNMPVYLAPGEQLTRDASLRPGRIHGRVTQPDGVTGAATPVQIFAPAPVMREGRDWGLADSSRPLATQSAPDGTYAVAGVNPGAYRVVASNSFFPTPVSAGGTLAPGADDEVNLALVSTLAGKIQGRVFRPDGETPAGPGVKVTLGGGSLADVTVQTDANGHYEFAEVFAEGSYTLTATDPVSGQTERARVSAQRNKDLLADLRLRGTGALRVTVVDGAGNPVPSAQVTLDGSEYPNAHRFAELTAEEAGAYQFDNLPEGRYAVSASRNGLGGRAAASVVAGTAVEVVVQLQATGTITGRVLMPDGTTAVGMADVVLKVGGRQLGFAVSSDADADRGTFVFTNVPAGEFTLDVLDNRTGRAGRAAGQLNEQGETVSLDVKLLPVGAVTGQVTANGQPVDHALVELYANGSGVRYEHLKATTDQQGRFRFTGIPAGSFQVSVTGAPGGQTGSASGVVTGTAEPLPDTVVDIALEPSVTVTGRVLRQDGAQPVNGARVRVSVGPRRFETTADETGAYRVAYVPLGEVSVRAESPSGLDRGESAAQTAAEPGATVTADVRMGGIGTVGGTALDSTGLPLSTGTVTFTNDAWRDAPLVVAAAVDSNGRYEIRGVPAGPFSLRLTVPNRVGVGSASAELSADQTLDLPVRLEDAGQVVGRLKSVDGVSPSAGADVTLNLVTTAGKSLRFYAHTDAAGAWRVANVPLGSVSASAYDNLTGGVARYGSAQLAANNQTLDLGERSLDNTPVRVVSVTPQNGAAAVSPVAPSISILFSEPVEPATITTGSVRLLRVTEGVPAAVSLSEDRRTVTLTPSGRLADTTGYTVVVNASVTDLAGNNLAGEVRSSFTTSDITAPTVQSVSPSNGASGVPLDSAVVVTFNEPLDRSQPFDAILSLTPLDADARPVTGSATLDESGRVMTYRPAAALEDAIAYRVSVNGQRDAAGNVQGDAYTSSFTSYVTPNQGTVRVEVRGTAGTLIQGAQLTLITSGGTLNAVSGLDGGYRFKPVALGDVTVQAIDPLTGLRGKALGRLNVAGEKLTLAVSLRSAGVVAGTVFRPDGSTPAAGVAVEVRSDAEGVIETVTTGADGRYAVDFVPLGGFTVEARDAATGDRGRVSNQLSVNGETRTINVTFNGLGRVRVTVQDASGGLVSGAQVRLTSQTQFGGTQTADSAADGTATFDRVFAGTFAVSATDPSTGLGGSQSGSVADGANADVTVRLRPAGTITGTVYAPGGSAPAGAVRVQLLIANLIVERETRAAADGTYRFETVPTGTYILEAFDAAGRRRAHVEGVSLTQNGQVVTRDLTFVGVGVVKGRVLMPGNTPVAEQSVSVNSPDWYFGGLFNAKTDAQGQYSISGVPVGAFTASAERSAEQLIGQTAGQVSRDGEEVTADIHLVSSAVNMPYALRDGNNFAFNVQPDGSVISNTPAYGYPWEVERGSSILSLVVNSAESTFNGPGVGSVAFGGREVSVRAGLAGLDVTRRVYVPEHGYFARYLEVLKNPTASPVTVDVRVIHNHTIYAQGGRRVTDTSSGDQAIDVSGATPDRWVVLDDGNPDAAMDPVAYVFDGAGAPEHVASAAYGEQTDRKLSYEWRQVTVAPGQTVAYMHFGVQQVGRSGAQASAARLAQLPPEALVGLRAEEATAVRNFALPADGASTVVPLPPLDGRVTVRVFASDGTTPVPGARVTLKSKNPLYGVTFKGDAEGDGSLTFATALNEYQTVTVPADAYTVTAEHGMTGAKVTAEGAFPTGANATTQNVVLAGTALVRGTVRRRNGAAAAGGSVYVSGGGKSGAVPIGGDGTYVATGLLADTTYAFSASVPVSGGSPLTSPPVQLTPGANQVLSADLTIVPTGAVTGTVRTAGGATAANVFVRISDASNNWTTRTNASGVYLFADVPAGGYTLSATEPTTQVQTNVSVSVSQDQTLTKDLTLVALGRVQVQVNYLNGQPAGGASVFRQTPARDTNFYPAGTTDSAGRLTINDVAAGAFVIRALHPADPNQVFADTAGTLTSNGEVVPVTVTLPGLGTVTGTVTYADGRVLASAPVQLMDGTNALREATTDAAGRYTLVKAPTGRDLKVRVTDPAGGARESAVFRLDADGETRTVDITLATRATVQVTALKSDGTPNAGAYVQIRHSLTGGQFNGVGNANSAGQVTALNVPEGPFTVSVIAPDGTYGGSIDGAVTPADFGGVVAVTVKAPPPVTLTGRVVAGDGVTPVSGAGVLVFNRNTSQLVRFDTRSVTDAQGNYTVPNVPPTVNGYKVAVAAPSSMSAFDQFVDPSEYRATITLNYTIPIGVVKGRVLTSDGSTPVPKATITVQSTDSAGVLHTWSQPAADAAGNYVIVGEMQGRVVRITAQDPVSRLGSDPLSVTMNDVTTPVQADILMPPGAQVVGTVYDADNNPVANARVYFTVLGGVSSSNVTTNAQGEFNLGLLKAGTYQLRGRDTQRQLYGAPVNVNVTTGQNQVRAEVRLPDSGALRGTVFRADGTPAAGATVTVENYENNWNGSWGFFRVKADAAGNYVVPVVQAGRLHVSATDAADAKVAGVTEDVLVPKGEAVINVTLAGALNSDLAFFVLDGADGFRYEFNGDGVLWRGRPIDGTLSNAYSRSHTLHFGSRFFTYFRVNPLEAGGREITFGTSDLDGLKVTRKVYSPQTGGFARYLEIFRNPTAADITLPVSVELYFGSFSSTHVYVSPSATGGLYAVTGPAVGTTNVPLVASVFGGPGARVAPPTAPFADGQYPVDATWNITVPAGQTVIIMHFTAQRDKNDQAGAQAQAEALVNLSDPHALDEMSAEEKAQVVNYLIPPSLISGQTPKPAGASPAAGARVSAGPRVSPAGPFAQFPRPAPPPRLELPALNYHANR